MMRRLTLTFDYIKHEVSHAEFEMDTTYRHLSSSSSLFNYLGDTANAKSALQDVVEKSKQANALGDAFTTFDSELKGNQVDAYLQKIESGEAALNNNTIANYLDFNRQKLATALSDLAAKLGISDDTPLTISNGKLQIDNSDGNKELDKTTLRLQQYLEKDSNLTSLIQQTSRLSQFKEWGDATSFASTLKEEGTDDAAIQSFLKEARLSVTSDNVLAFNQNGFGFTSDGQTAALIEAFEKQ